jgi:hypothetical protein
VKTFLCGAAAPATQNGSATVTRTSAKTWHRKEAAVHDSSMLDWTFLYSFYGEYCKAKAFRIQRSQNTEEQGNTPA